MDTIQYRLIFKRLIKSAQIRKIHLFFQKEIGLPDDTIRILLTSPPRILMDVSSRQNALHLQEALEKFGCLTSVDTVVSNPMFPFPISRKKELILKKELSKILRCRANMALFLLQLNPIKAASLLPSMIGSFEKQLGDYFRESDTVVGLDDSRLIVLGFGTDRQGASIFRNKLDHALKELLTEEVESSIGLSLFPEDGRAIHELIFLAESNRIAGDKSESLKSLAVSKPPPSLRNKKDNVTLSALQLCFTKGHGKIFQRLLDMEPKTLWLGLSQLTSLQQREFLNRMPYDSSLVPTLEDMIETNYQPAEDKTAEQHFEAIIHQMELEEGIEDRQKAKDELFLKLSRVEELPTLPSVALEIFELASSPATSAAQLGEVIKNDPSLTIKLLQIVNSAFYGNVQEVETTRQAVVLLGTDEITDIAFGLAAAKVFDGKTLGGMIDPQALWRHSICTGLIAQDLYRKTPDSENLSVFTAGLLHDVGKIFLIDHFQDPYKQIHSDLVKGDFPLFELEQEKFGINHALIGKNLSSSWNLPESLVQAIAFHHQPYAAPDHAQLAALIGLADFLYYRAILPDDADEERKQFASRLTTGHWHLYRNMFPNWNNRELEIMVEDASNIIQNSNEFFAMMK